MGMLRLRTTGRRSGEDRAAIVGYMEHDDRRRRFFGYLNLFVAAMLVTVGLTVRARR